MKIALLGKGKTGSKVLENKTHQIVAFDSINPPTFEKLKSFDLIISFLPGEVFKNFISLLIETKLPVVTGSTGFDWPENFDQKLKEKNLSWIYATNFSLGMALVKQILEKLSQAKKYFQLIKYLFTKFIISKKRCAERNSVKYGKMDRRKMPYNIGAYGRCDWTT